MQSVGIITDSSSCLPLEFVERFDIEMLPLQFAINCRTYLNGVDITPSRLYAKGFTPAMGVHTRPGLLAIACWSGE
jgi:fatty acid-binding protein DegV